jgi:hypothetical protein
MEKLLQPVVFILLEFSFCYIYYRPKVKTAVKKKNLKNNLAIKLNCESKTSGKWTRTRNNLLKYPGLSLSRSFSKKKKKKSNFASSVVFIFSIQNLSKISDQVFIFFRKSRPEFN